MQRGPALELPPHGNAREKGVFVRLEGELILELPAAPVVKEGLRLRLIQSRDAVVVQRRDEFADEGAVFVDAEAVQAHDAGVGAAGRTGGVHVEQVKRPGLRAARAGVRGAQDVHVPVLQMRRAAGQGDRHPLFVPGAHVADVDEPAAPTVAELLRAGGGDADELAVPAPGQLHPEGGGIGAALRPEQRVQREGALGLRAVAGVDVLRAAALDVGKVDHQITPHSCPLPSVIFTGLPLASKATA